LWTIAASLVVLLVAWSSFHLLGIAWRPSGNAPSSVLQANNCPDDGDLIVEGPQDRSAEANADYDRAHQWALRMYEPDKVMHLGNGGYGDERFVRSQLPWRVRFRLSYDSESGMMALYGTRADICMAARVIANRR
jgi:hypothetical protein